MRQFISYPKSGRSWLRYALTRLGIANSILFHHDGCEFNDGAKPPHDFEYVKRLERFDRSTRVVYLHRDPRDTLVSLFHQVTGRFSDRFNYKGTISEFIRDPYFGAANLQRFRCQWSALCADGRALPISYEACHADFKAILGTVVSYYGFEIEENALIAAAIAADFDHMKAIEKMGSVGRPWLQLRNGSPKVRRGKVGGYIDELPTDDIDYLDDLFSRDSHCL